MHFSLQLHKGNLNQFYVAFEFFLVYFELHEGFLEGMGYTGRAGEAARKA